VLDADRVGSLLDGARRFASSAAIIAPEASAQTPTARAEQAADALLDLLAEDTPASRLVTEQLVLVLSASSRQLFSELRARSGTLQERSLLGTIVDPLGIFRQSALINNDDRDRAALAAAEKLAALATEILADASAGDVVTGGGAIAPSAAGAIDQQQLARALVVKAYERREDVQRVSRRVAIEALDQATLRLTRPGS
jgi:hypothetical protein